MRATRRQCENRSMIRASGKRARVSEHRQHRKMRITIRRGRKICDPGPTAGVHDHTCGSIIGGGKNGPEIRGGPQIRPERGSELDRNRCRRHQLMSNFGSAASNGAGCRLRPNFGLAHPRTSSFRPPCGSPEELAPQMQPTLRPNLVKLCPTSTYCYDQCWARLAEAAVRHAERPRCGEFAHTLQCPWLSVQLC